MWNFYVWKCLLFIDSIYQFAVFSKRMVSASVCAVCVCSFVCACVCVCRFAAVFSRFFLLFLLLLLVFFSNITSIYSVRLFGDAHTHTLQIEKASFLSWKHDFYYFGNFRPVRMAIQTIQHWIDSFPKQSNNNNDRMREWMNECVYGVPFQICQITFMNNCDSRIHMCTYTKCLCTASTYTVSTHEHKHHKRFLYL